MIVEARENMGCWKVGLQADVATSRSIGVDEKY